ASDAAELLVELVGSGMGLLDQELAKLAVAVGAKPAIAAEDVERLVGRSKAAGGFRILGAGGDGKPGRARGNPADPVAGGAGPRGILGPLTAQLRKLAMVWRLHGREKQAFGPAMDAAGVPRWPKIRESTERQLKHLGGRRLEKLTEWLAEINLGLKGGSALP